MLQPREALVGEVRDEDVGRALLVHDGLDDVHLAHGSGAADEPGAMSMLPEHGNNVAGQAFGGHLKTA